MAKCSKWKFSLLSLPSAEFVFLNSGGIFSLRFRHCVCLCLVKTLACLPALEKPILRPNCLTVNHASLLSGKAGLAIKPGPPVLSPRRLSWNCMTWIQLQWASSKGFVYICIAVYLLSGAEALLSFMATLSRYSSCEIGSRSVIDKEMLDVNHIMDSYHRLFMSRLHFNCFVFWH